MTDTRTSRRQRNAPTINDVARHAGVSPMTVSRVINGEQVVKAETRAKVEEAIKALNYSPSAAARSLAGGDETRIGQVAEGAAMGEAVLLLQLRCQRQLQLGKTG
ncbi:LacI family DNA-binding transcriptional regulator, partial [Sphingobium sp.]|uniref:LacI family DNA-binding transcriptional regulator n=1 Tax=Sphingobium sp. TaxID=1912891 RepID=UPI002BBFD897